MSFEVEILSEIGNIYRNYIAVYLIYKYFGLCIHPIEWKQWS